MYECQYPHLFTPIVLAGQLFRNRIFASPTGMQSNHYGNRPNNETICYFERKAIGGAASVCIGDAMVDSEIALANGAHILLDDPGQRAHLSRLSESIRRHGAVASMELSHGGSSARISFAQGHKIYGPVELESEGSFGQPIHAYPMDEAIIQRTIRKFAEAAANAKRWGYGMVTIHGGHGWLLHQFMSPELNTRTDRWGGSFENNMRLPLAIVDAVRAAVGPGFPIEMRISGAECFAGGYDIDYGIRIAEAFDGRVDIIHVSTGSHENDDTFTITHPSMFLEDGCNVKYAAAIKPHIKHSKVAAVGALSDPAMMEDIIASGRADIVEMARGLICDPDLPLKAHAGREDEIRHCMRCFACFGGLIQRGAINCAQNPEIGHEREFRYEQPAPVHKKVLIAGGGIAGMQAAITCAERGHEVILCEKTGRLGGILRCEGKVPFKAHLDEYLDYQEKLTAKRNVKVLLNTAVTPEFARSVAPDVIVSAVGAVPSMPPIPGIRGENVLDVVTAYSHPELARGDVVILGAGFSGQELSIFYKKYFGHNCTILEMMPELSDGGNLVHSMALKYEIKVNGIDIRLGTRCVEITPEGVWGECGGERVFFPADTVVVALGMRSRNDDNIALANCAPEYYQIGDANSPRNICVTTDEACQTARDIGRI